MNFGDGTGVVNGPSFENVSHTYTQEGIYYPMITVTDIYGHFLTDTIAVVVYDRAEIDSLLKSKWNGMKAKLIEGDIEGALGYFYDKVQERYRYIFTNILQVLPNIASNMNPIEMIYAENGVVQYRIKRMEDAGEITYYIYFVIDDNGIWKIKQF